MFYRDERGSLDTVAICDTLTSAGLRCSITDDGCLMVGHIGYDSAGRTSVNPRITLDEAAVGRALQALGTHTMAGALRKEAERLETENETAIEVHSPWLDTFPRARGKRAEDAKREFIALAEEEGWRIDQESTGRWIVDGQVVYCSASGIIRLVSDREELPHRGLRALRKLMSEIEQGLLADR